MPHWCRLHAASDIAMCDDGMSLKEHYHPAVLRQVVAQKAQAHTQKVHTKVKDPQGKQRLTQKAKACTKGKAPYKRLAQKAKAHTEIKGLHREQEPLQEAHTKGKGPYRSA